MQASVIVVLVALILLVVGAVVVIRGLMRPVDPDGSDGWRSGQAFAVMGCGVVMALMIPRYSCPPGTTLSVVFRFCRSQTEVYPAPSTGFPWKLAALGVGLVLGLLLLRWRSLAWPITTVVVAAAFALAAGYTAHRTTGLPWERRAYTVGLATRAPALAAPPARGP